MKSNDSAENLSKDPVIAHNSSAPFESPNNVSLENSKADLLDYIQRLEADILGLTTVREALIEDLKVAANRETAYCKELFNYALRVYQLESQIASPLMVKWHPTLPEHPGIFQLPKGEL